MNELKFEKFGKNYRNSISEITTLIYYINKLLRTVPIVFQW